MRLRQHCSTAAYGFSGGINDHTRKAVDGAPANIVLQPTALRRARSELFCVLESRAAQISVALARAARRRLNTSRWAAFRRNAITLTKATDGDALERHGVLACTLSTISR